MKLNSAGWVRQAPMAVAGMLGMSIPIVLAALAGRASLGVAASLGGMALSGDGGSGATFRKRALGLFFGLLAGGAAMFAGSMLSGHGLRYYIGLPLVAGVAALLGSLSRPLARATTLFVIYAIIAAHIGTRGNHPVGMMFLFVLGAVWTAVLSLGLKSLLLIVQPSDSPDTAPASKYTVTQYLNRWKRALVHLSGWQYTIRLTACLAAAQAYNWLWPHHHGDWASLTVVIVVQRNLQTALKRTLHRAAGTAIGVLFTGLLLIGSPPLWSLIILIACLAAARPVLRETNYMAYAAVMTPLVILLLEFGQNPSWVVAMDRLVATLVGCGLALTLGYPGWSRLAVPERAMGTR